MKKRILAAAIGLAVPTLWADETETIGGYTWTFATNDVEAVITGVTPQPTGDLAIPSVLAEKTVAGIGEGVFADCYGLTSVVIGDGVRNIGTNAFNRCHGLTNVTMGINVADIGANAFWDCKTLSGRLTIPNSVTNIGAGAFRYCSGLTGVTIGAGVASIGLQAFDCCGKLASVIIPDGVRDIGGEAFGHCEGLTSFVVSGTVTNIGERVLVQCTSLRAVYFLGNAPAVGGFAGYIKETPSVFECSAVGTVAKTGSGNSYVGGFVGQHEGGFVADSYSNVSVDGGGAGYVGGFMGYGCGGGVSKAYCSGSVVSTAPNSYVGAFVGNMYSGFVTNSYFNSGATEQQAAGKNGSAAAGYAGIDPVAAGGMKSAASFPAFDFEETWNIDEGATMPYLRCFYVFEITHFAEWVADRNLPAGSKPDDIVGGLELGARYVFGIDRMDAVLNAANEPVFRVEFDENGKPYVQFAEIVRDADLVSLVVLASEDVRDWDDPAVVPVDFADGTAEPSFPQGVPATMFFKWRITIAD